MPLLIIEFVYLLWPLCYLSHPHPYLRCIPLLHWARVSHIAGLFTTSPSHEWFIKSPSWLMACHFVEDEAVWTGGLDFRTIPTFPLRLLRFVDNLFAGYSSSRRCVASVTCVFKNGRTFHCVDWWRLAGFCLPQQEIETRVPFSCSKNTKTSRIKEKT